MFWYRKVTPVDTVYSKFGLMTLTTRKVDGDWKWVAVTNQHTPWFYPREEPVITDE